MSGKSNVGISSSGFMQSSPCGRGFGQGRYEVGCATTAKTAAATTTTKTKTTKNKTPVAATQTATTNASATATARVAERENDHLLDAAITESYEDLSGRNSQLISSVSPNSKRIGPEVPSPSHPARRDSQSRIHPLLEETTTSIGSSTINHKKCTPAAAGKHNYIKDQGRRRGWFSISMLPYTSTNPDVHSAQSTPNIRHRSVASRDPRPARASRAPRAPTRAPAKVLSQSQTWSLNSDLDPPLDPSQAEAVAAAAAAAASVPDCQQSPTQGHGACRGQKEGGKASRSEINPESMRFVPTSLTRQFISSVPAEAFPSKTKPTSSVGTIRQARRRQDTSPPPAFPAPTYTAIQDPSLGAILQPDRQTDPGTALASSTSPSTATTTTTTTTTTDATTSTNSLPTAITVTIVLATVAGLATLSLASFVLYLRWKRRRSGSSRVSSGLHLEDDSKRHCNNNNSSPSAPSPPLPPPPPPHSPVPFTASFGMGIDSISASENGTLTPPPRLLERKYHNSTKSDSSIELVRKYTHTRWGKPSSLSILSSSSPTQEPQPAAVYQPFGQREDSLFRDPRTPPLAGPSYRHGDKMNQHVFPAGSASPRTQGAVSGTPTSSSIYSNLLDSSSLTSPPRTPNVPPEVMGLASPGPPPNRALPSPPLKHWQVNPLSPPPDTEIDHIRPEDIGIAIGSPSYSNDSKRREKRPRLDESDMERLGGTYSPFKR